MPSTSPREDAACDATGFQGDVPTSRQKCQSQFTASSKTADVAEVAIEELFALQDLITIAKTASLSTEEAGESLSMK